MKTARLRNLIRRYGNFGVLLVGIYLAIHSLWTKRRRVLLLTGTVALATLLVLVSRRESHRGTVSVLLPHSASANVSPPAPQTKPKSKKTYHPKRSLLAHARPVLALDKHYRTHFWKSADRLLLITSTKSDHDYVYIDLETWTGQAQILDLRTGRFQKLMGLTRVFHRMHATPYWFETSPDGKWLKWINYITGDGWPNPAVARWDGSRFQQWDQDKFNETYWLDDHRWVEEEQHNESREDGLGRPRDLIIHDAQRQKTVRLKQTSRAARRLMHKHDIASTPQFQAIYPEEGPNSPRVTIIEEVSHNSIGKASSKRHTYNIAMPIGADIKNVLICPATRRVLYILQFPQTKQAVATDGEPAIVDVWCSAIDGSGLHDLGFVETDEQYEEWLADGTHTRALMRVEWLPDGKHWSFIYGRKLYLASLR